MGTSLFAGPPMLSNDPYPPDKGHYEVNVAYEYEHSNEARLHTVPIIDANYGLNEDIQLTVSQAYLFENKDPKGVDALELSMKWIFYRGAKLTVALSPVYLSYPFHTSLSSGKTYELHTLFDLKLSDNVRAVFDTGYEISQSDYDLFELGAYLQYTKKRSNYFFELFSNTTKVEQQVVLNLGYTYKLNERYLLMYSMGHDLMMPVFVSYMGVQIAF